MTTTSWKSVRMLISAWLGLIASGCIRGDAATQDSATTAAAQGLIADQATTEFGVWARSSGIVVRPEDVLIESGPNVGSSLTILRGVPPRDHWHPYLVAIKDDQAYPLGGFSSPDLIRAVSWVAPKPVIREDFVQIARKLAMLGDEEGAVRWFFPAQVDDSVRKGAMAWERSKPNNWPADTVIGGPSGGRWEVRVTIVSQQTRSYDVAWRATAFDFRFTQQGTLASWSRRTSEKFYALAAAR